MIKNQYSKQRAVVIGGGVSGLATAALLSKQGWKVTVVEKNQTLGGRARVLEIDEFRFDMGPSWYMMPEIFERYFAEFGKKVEDYYQLKRLNPRYKIFFGTDRGIPFDDNLEQNIAEFEKIESGSGRRLKQFLQTSKKVYDSAASDLIYQNVWNVAEFFKIKNLTSLFELSILLPLWISWQNVLGRYFQSQKLKQVLGFTSLFLGGSPAMTPSTFSILAWADFGRGIWYPRGGMIQIVDALEQLCIEQGVEIITGQEVSKIEVHGKQVAGVRTNSSQLPAQVVVGATDLPWLESQLLDKEHQSYPESYWKDKKMGISSLMIYLGLNKRFPKLAHHNLYFSENWEKNFSEIFETQEIPSDPSLYISVRSITDRTLVPKNCEEVVILVPLGARTTYSSDQLQQLSNKVIGKVESLFHIPLKKHIAVKKLFTPTDFKDYYNAYRGSALGLAHTARQSLWWRPKHRSAKVRGLYYAGQYTNPGIGVPTSIVSAQIVARMIGYADLSQDSIFKKGSTTYYYSSLFFRGQIKQDVFTLYAYVRTIDDFVDAPVPNIKQLEKYWQETVKAWKGAKTELHVVDQFVRMAKGKDIKWKWVEAFWQAMRSDLKKKSYKNFAELEKYMYGSAGVIGLMMAQILDLPAAAHETAVAQGRAMQLLNFIRDVDEDKKMGRKYLVYDDDDTATASAWEHRLDPYIQKYYSLQEEAEAGYRFLPKKYLVPIRTAASMYKQTAQIIERDPMIVWQKKVKPRRWQVILEAVRNIAR